MEVQPPEVSEETTAVAVREEKKSEITVKPSVEEVTISREKLIDLCTDAFWRQECIESGVWEEALRRRLSKFLSRDAVEEVIAQFRHVLETSTQPRRQSVFSNLLILVARLGSWLSRILMVSSVAAEYA